VQFVVRGGNQIDLIALRILSNCNGLPRLEFT
jgi:hypothetical protein